MLWHSGYTLGLFRYAIISALLLAALGVGDRVGRALKAQCGGLIISDSQQGYKHILDATPGEFHHAANEIRSRVRELQSYLLAMERVYHREGQTA